MKKRAGYLYDPIQIEWSDNYHSMLFGGSGEDGALPFYVSGDGRRHIEYAYNGYDQIGATDSWHIYVSLPYPSDPYSDMYSERYDVEFEVAQYNFVGGPSYDQSPMYNVNGEVESMEDALAEWIEANISYPSWVEEYYQMDSDVEEIMNGGYGEPQTYEDFIDKAVDWVGVDEEIAEDIYEWARKNWVGIPEKTSRKAMKKRAMPRERQLFPDNFNLVEWEVQPLTRGEYTFKPRKVRGSDKTRLTIRQHANGGWIWEYLNEDGEQSSCASYVTFSSPSDAYDDFMNNSGRWASVCYTGLNRKAIAMKKCSERYWDKDNVLWLDGRPNPDDWNGGYDRVDYPFTYHVQGTLIWVGGELHVGSDWDFSDEVDEDGKSMYNWRFDQAWVEMEIGVQDENDLYYTWLDHVSVEVDIDDESDVLSFGTWLAGYLDANWDALHIGDIDQEGYDYYDADAGYNPETGEFDGDRDELVDAFYDRLYNEHAGDGRKRMTHHASYNSKTGSGRKLRYPDDFGLTSSDIPDLDMWWPQSWPSAQSTPEHPYSAYNYTVRKDGLEYFLSICAGNIYGNGDYVWYITPSPMEWPQIGHYYGVYFDTPQEALDDMRNRLDEKRYASRKSANHRKVSRRNNRTANARVRIAAHKLATAINGKELGEEIRDQMFNDDYGLGDEIDYDEVSDLIYDEADQALAYYDDLWDTARLYADSSKVVELFWEEFLGDIFDGFGDIDEAVEEYNGNHREAKRRSARRRISGRKVRR